MKTLITILIIAAFIQTTILPIDLVLIILICRSYTRLDKNNLFLGFAFGLFNSHLYLTTLGFQSLIYLILIQMTHMLSKTRLAGNSLLIVPLSLVLLSINQILNSLFIHQTIELFPKVFLESLLSWPIFIAVRLWEERFIARKGIKLKI